jgi:carbon-monoxide dehydrogenase medium subunit
VEGQRTMWERYHRPDRKRRSLPEGKRAATPARRGVRPFRYEAPSTVNEALELLDQYGPDARVLAGGQSLLILMRQRLVQPEVVVSLSRIPALRTIETDRGGLRIGAMVTYREASRDPRVVGTAGLLARAAGSVGSIHIRARGTIGGAVCHADPAGDVLVALMALDGTIETHGAPGTHGTPGGPEASEFAAADFPTGLFSTRLAPGSIAPGVRVPAQHEDARFGYRRFLLREGEYPMTQTAVRIVPRDGRVVDARVAIGGAGDRPRRIPEAEAFLVGQPLDDQLLDDFAEVIAANVRPTPDVRGGTWWKTRVIAATARRALAEALTPAPAGADARGTAAPGP